MSKHTPATPTQCDGSCEHHEGEVVPVSVQGWGNFKYCSAAIAEDRKRGLVVTEVEKAEGEQQ
jgi:hypothetical protein